MHYNFISELSDHQKFTTFARTTALYRNMAFFLLDILEHYGWDHVVIVEGPESIWRETAGFFQVSGTGAFFRF